jgi:hypothetical protein
MNIESDMESDRVLQPLRVLHPDDGGFVTFHAEQLKKDGTLNPFGLVTALRPTDLGGLFPEYIKSLVRNAYFT